MAKIYTIMGDDTSRLQCDRGPPPQTTDRHQNPKEERCVPELMSALGEARPGHVGFASVQVAQIPKGELGAVCCTDTGPAAKGEENASMISQWEGQEKLEGLEEWREDMGMADGGAGGTTAVRLRPEFRHSSGYSLPLPRSEGKAGAPGRMGG